MLLLVVICLWAPLAHAQNTTNTCNPPNIPGFTYQDNCKLICRASQWTDIVIFFLGNYVAHAATVVSKPGQSPISSLVAVITAFLFPGGGIRSGVDAIMSLAKRGETPLRIAARAGALCAVVKVDDSDDNTPEENSPEDSKTAPESKETPGSLAPLLPKKEPHPFRTPRIHGLARLPQGYDLLLLPPTSTFLFDEPPPKASTPSTDPTTSPSPSTDPTLLTNLSSSYNLIKILISLLQLLFAISTLYRTRGNQVARYGYAAFGLTTIPYAWMSLVNLVGNILCPQYDCLYLVGSEGLDQLEDRLRLGTEEERKQWMVRGTVGKLTAEADDELKREWEELVDGKGEIATGVGKRKGRSFWALGWELGTALAMESVSTNSAKGILGLVLSYYIAAVPIAVVGGLSRFEAGNSALYQQVWTMMWLVLGFSVGALLPPPADYLEGRPVIGARSPRKKHGMAGMLSRSSIWFKVLLMVYYAAPAIGGYVVVAQMLTDFGVCSLNQFQG